MQFQMQHMLLNLQPLIQHTCLRYSDVPEDFLFLDQVSQIIVGVAVNVAVH